LDSAETPLPNGGSGGANRSGWRRSTATGGLPSVHEHVAGGPIWGEKWSALDEGEVEASRETERERNSGVQRRQSRSERCRRRARRTRWRAATANSG
jgi:hypothetical protein